jgi:hypothetical protein
MKNAVSTSVRENTPSTGLQISMAPTTTDKAAMMSVQMKAGTPRTENNAASPKTPLIRNNQPTNISTAMVAKVGAAKATAPRITMITR